MDIENLSIYEKFRSVPEEAQKPITGGKLNGMTDINPMWRIKALTSEFGACGIGWYYTVDKQWIEPVKDEICAFVNISLYIKVNNEWSMPIHGTGGSKLAALEKGKIAASDECYKMATTDALSVSCKQLGIGADIYWSKDKTKYSSAETESEAPVKPATRAEMISCVNRFYPEGSEKRKELLECWHITNLNDAKDTMLQAVWNKYGGK